MPGVTADPGTWRPVPGLDGYEVDAGKRVRTWLWRELPGRRERPVVVPSAQRNWNRDMPEVRIVNVGSKSGWHPVDRLHRLAFPELYPEPTEAPPCPS